MSCQLMPGDLLNTDEVLSQAQTPSQTEQPAPLPIAPATKRTREHRNIQILQNGFVFENPTYAYTGHGYEYDVTPGDNDLPWLRQYAIDHQVFAGIDMMRDWKEREWEMIQAIIFHTSHTLTYTGINTDPALRFRAKIILTGAMEHPEYTWGCGEVSMAAAGLAQAHGIPCRLVNGHDFQNPLNSDYCCEMYSTRFNRWVFLMPHVNAWIEHETDGPLGVRELHLYDEQSLIQARYDPVEMHWSAEPNPPLVFQPSSICQAPIPPHISMSWWSGYFHHFAFSWFMKINGPPNYMLEVFNDDFLNVTLNYNPPVPVIAIDDLNITYPLNNVEADAALQPHAVRITVKNNMFEFIRYEMSVDAGPWGPMTLAPLLTANAVDLSTYLWQPDSDSTLALRGSNLAGVNSPDVVIKYTRNSSGGQDESR